jgi:hypothetical protein
MEVLALAGLLGVGYMLTKGTKENMTSDVPHDDDDEAVEGFASPTGMPTFMPMGGQPAPVYQQDRTPPGSFTIPGLPRQPNRMPDGELDQFYSLPSGGSLPSEPLQQPDLYQRNLLFSAPAPTLTPQAPPTAVTSQVRMNDDGVETAPVYNFGKTVVSALTGVAMPAEEFTHNNMVPFFKGAPKQNMTAELNSSRLDNMIGMGSIQIAKREQAPLFEPVKEPMGNVHGLESFTSWAQDRVIASTNRAFEKPVDSVHVGPGLGQGYSSLPIGGFQQLETQEIAKQRMNVDELRYASNPKVTYDRPMIAGKAINTLPGTIGEVRKYHPDTFYLNEHGERNFVTTGENTRATERAGQVMKVQMREDTTVEYMGTAQSADFTATYTVPSFRAPLNTQLEGFGYRNADGSTYGVADTDVANNDFGRAGVELPVNQRNVTGERVTASNVTAAAGGKAMTVYDPNDVARTTVRETTGANDWVGIAAPASAATKLTVYDPTDIMRPTGRNTMAEPDRALNVTRAGVPGQTTMYLQDQVRLTTKGQVTAQSAYSGTAGPATEKAQPSYNAAYNMRQYPTKELLSSGRKPVAGNGQLVNGLFNGQDNMNVSHRKIETDWINDRDTTSDRVVGLPISTDAIGLQRPRQPVKLDISTDRNIHDILDSLNDNPYALPVYRIAAGLAGPAELAAAGGGGGGSSF